MVLNSILAVSVIGVINPPPWYSAIIGKGCGGSLTVLELLLYIYTHVGGSLENYGAAPEDVLGKIVVSVSEGGCNMCM